MRPSAVFHIIFPLALEKVTKAAAVEGLPNNKFSLRIPESSILSARLFLRLIIGSGQLLVGVRETTLFA